MTVSDFNVELALSYTMYKAQGRTLRFVIGDLNHPPSKPWVDFESVFVLLSRVTHQRNLKLLPLQPGGSWDHLAKLRPNGDLVAWLNGFSADGKSWFPDKARDALVLYKQSERVFEKGQPLLRQPRAPPASAAGAPPASRKRAASTSGTSNTAAAIAAAAATARTAPSTASAATATTRKRAASSMGTSTSAASTSATARKTALSASAAAARAPRAIDLFGGLSPEELAPKAQVAGLLSVGAVRASLTVALAYSQKTLNHCQTDRGPFTTRSTASFNLFF